jgi:A/G-specific adenine glycosylase
MKPINGPRLSSAAARPSTEARLKRSNDFGNVMVAAAEDSRGPFIDWVCCGRKKEFESPHVVSYTGLVRRLLSWFSENARDLPWRRTRDPYAIWVSEIMLQQTQVKTVIPYWRRWMKALPDIRALARARPERIHKLWEGLGYYTRVRNMQKAAQQIVAEHGGAFPADFEKVLDLPGIGRYTAGAVCSIAFNQPTPILDGNVIRVLARLFGVRGNPRDKKVNEKLWGLAGEMVRQAAPKYCSELNQALMELGALVCTPRSPNCGECPISTQCVALRKGIVEELPRTPARPQITRRRFAAFIVRDGKTVFVRQRPEGVVNAHLWEFPNVEILPGDGDLQKAAAFVLGTRAAELQRVCTIKHSITRYAISMDVYDARFGLDDVTAPGQWLTLRRLDQLPFCSAHKRILTQLNLPPG